MTADQLTVTDAGEDAVLEAITEVIAPFNAQRSGMPLGPGDDAACLSFPAGAAVITTDTMSEGQDFRRQWWLGPEELGGTEFEPVAEWPMDIGTKAAAQNLSDINAMGAEPTALLVSLTLPPQTPVAWVQDFYRGMIRACSAAGAENCVIAGGDLGSGEVISVTITALGAPPEDGKLLRRSSATAGELLAVNGALGYAAAGLEVLEWPGAEAVTEAEEQHWEDHAEIIRSCLKAQQQPEPVLTAGPSALAAGATAGMDLSDGLLRDAQRLAEASGVRVRLDDEVLTRRAGRLEPVAELIGPASAAQRAAHWVLSGGEDYGLLATFPESAELPEGFEVIGRIEQGSAEVLTGLETGRRGWDSLAP